MRHEFPTTGKVHHSIQCLAFPTGQTHCLPARTGFDLRPAQNNLEDKRLPMQSHHLRVTPKKVVRPLDSLLRQRITARELGSQAVPMADQIIEIRQKTSKSVRIPKPRDPPRTSNPGTRRKFRRRRQYLRLADRTAASKSPRNFYGGRSSSDSVNRWRDEPARELGEGRSHRGSTIRYGARSQSALNLKERGRRRRIRKLD